MELRSRVFRVALTMTVGLVGLSFGSSSEVEASGYADLCTSVPGQCDYAPLATAPLLRADVCYKDSNNTTTLKGAGDCTGGARPYYLDYGEVISGYVYGYVALADACDQGYCEIFPPGTAPGDITEICCQEVGTNDHVCYTDLNQCASGSGELVWCDDVQDNQDGTVSCAEPE